MSAKVALITGAARGIGFGIATCLARQGTRIVIADLDGRSAKKSAAQLAKATGVPTLGLACDIAVRTQVASLVRQTMKRFGQIDILVNNAGICPFVDIMEMSEAMFKKTIDVNLHGAFHCTQLVAKEMIKRGRGGRIIFITSLAVNVSSAAQGDYAASKAGLHMLMKSFAIALGPKGITCNAVAPGMILTDMTRFHWEKPEPAAFVKQRVPVGRIGTPEDIGNAVTLLCSDAAAYINGVGLIVDGGHQAVRMKIDLTGRVALVTGATGELGRVITRTLAGCGARVGIHYHHAADRAAALQAELPGACSFQADITSKAAIDRMRDAVKAQLGAPDIIVANAVIQYQWTKVLEQSPDDYRSQFESCVLQNVLMAQAFIPDMIAKKRGRVIAINTECAMQNTPNQSAYVAGKRGMDGVLRVLAREVGGHGITVNQVAPGWMVSENRPAAGRPDSYREGIPLKRWGTDQDVANAVAFLASDLAGYISGVYLPVCGGNAMPAI